MDCKNLDILGPQLVHYNLYQIKFNGLGKAFVLVNDAVLTRSIVLRIALHQSLHYHSLLYHGSKSDSWLSGSLTTHSSLAPSRLFVVSEDNPT